MTTFARVAQRGMIWVAAGMLVVSVSTPVWAGNHGSADVQWAQEILRQKGLFHGRPNGDLDGPTRSALTTFQKSAGLPASGQLDAGTIAKLGAARPASATMGQLGVPPRGGPAAASRESVKADPTAHAAPRGSVAAQDRGGSAVIGSFSRPAGESAPGPLAQAPAPQAAPRAAVSARPVGAMVAGAAVGAGVAGGIAAASSSHDNSPGGATPATAAPTPVSVKVEQSNEGDGPVALTAPGWVRGALLGVIAGVFGILGWSWWRNGRRGAAWVGSAAETADHRREPSFGNDLDSGLRAWRPSGQA